MKTVHKICYTLAGALLMGLLWRLRGTHGWGAAWGLLATGFVFTLFLTSVLQQKRKQCFPFLAVTAFSFMLTTPAWGTLLEQITGILTLRSNTSDETLQIFVHPLSAIIMMLLLGFGLASVFGVMLGHLFSDKRWRLRDYMLLAVVFFVVGFVAKAYPAHWLLSHLQPQAVAAFTAELQKSAVPHGDSVLAFYYAHFGNIAAAKGILGGRHYFSSVETIAFSMQAIAVLLTVRLLIRDRTAARTGAVVCGSFAAAITVSDLFFFFGAGGYHFAQGFSLPDTVAPWSMWEYCTGFLAGGLITAYMLHSATYSSVTDETAGVIFRKPLPQKFQSALFFLLLFVGAIGLNAVRPVLERLDESAWQIPTTAFVSVLVLCGSVLAAKRYGTALERAGARLASGILCVAFVTWFTVLYLWIGSPEICSMQMLHNQLLVISAVAVNTILIYSLLRLRKT